MYRYILNIESQVIGGNSGQVYNAGPNYKSCATQLNRQFRNKTCVTSLTRWLNYLSEVTLFKFRNLSRHYRFDFFNSIFD